MHWPAPWLKFEEPKSERAEGESPDAVPAGVAGTAHRRLCRLCAADVGEPIAGFAPMPVAGVYLDPMSTGVGPRQSLTVVRCTGCGLVQLCESSDPGLCASSYHVAASGRDARHHAALVKALGKSLPPHARVHCMGQSRPLEALLVRAGFRTSGFAPPADAVLARHVFDRSEDPGSPFREMEAVAGPNTLLFVETADLGETVRNRVYSNFSHARVNYFDVASLGRLLDQHGWKPEGALTVPVAGGSLLAWASRKGRPTGSRLPFFPLEGGIPAAVCPHELDQFAGGWNAELAVIREFFEKQKAAGVRVAGYGAAQRTVALLGTAGLDSTHLTAVYDANPALEGLLLPGTRIPVRPVSALALDQPQLLVIFARSYEEEIAAMLPAFRGRMVTLRTSPPALIGGRREAA